MYRSAPHISFRGIALVLGVWLGALACAAAVGAQGTSARRGSGGLRVPADNEASVTLTAINGQPVDPERGVVLPFLRPGEGVDVAMEAWATTIPEPPESDEEGATGEQRLVPWVLAKGLGDTRYKALGPARQKHVDDRPVWIVPEAQLPVSGSRPKHFLLRAALFPEGADPSQSGDPLTDAVAVSSPPVPLVVLRWAEDSGDLRLDAIGSAAVDPETRVEVETSADVSGTLNAGADNEGADAPSAQSFVYVVLHPSLTDVWKVVGPAEIRGGRFYLRDVVFALSGFRNCRYMDVFAVRTREPLDVRRTEYGSWESRELAATASAKVFIKDPAVAMALRQPRLTYTRCIPSEGNPQQLSSNQTTLQVATPEFSLKGKVEGLDQGLTLWGLLCPVGTGKWIVQEGPALVEAGNWSLPRIRLEAPLGLPARRFRLLVIASERSLSGGIIDFGSWAPDYVAATEPLMVECTSTSTQLSGGETQLTIAQVGSSKVADKGVVQPPPSPPVVISGDGLPQDGLVLLGRTAAGLDRWTFVAAYSTGDETWTAPVLPPIASAEIDAGARLTAGGEPPSGLAGVDTPGPRPAGPSAFREEEPGSVSATPAPAAGNGDSGEQTLVAIMTHAPLPSGRTTWSYAEWRGYAWVISPMVQVTRTAPTGRSGSLAATLSPLGSPIVGWSWPRWWWIVALAVLLALVAGEYYFGVGSLLTAEAARMASEARGYVRSEISSIPRPDAMSSLVGLVLLGLEVAIIAGYFEAHRRRLQNVLHVARVESLSLAVLIIGGVAIIGIVAEVTYRYGRPSASSPSDPASHADVSADGTKKAALARALYLFSLTVTVAMGAALLFFVGLLYQEDALAHVAEGSRMPFAMGCFAVFVASAELMLVFWVTRLALPFLTWFCIHAVLLPLWILEQGGRLLHAILRSLPCRADTHRRPGWLTRAEIRRAADRFILTHLGVQMAPSAPELIWRVKVTHPSTAAPAGEIQVDPQSGDVEWCRRETTEGDSSNQ